MESSNSVKPIDGLAVNLKDFLLADFGVVLNKSVREISAAAAAVGNDPYTYCADTLGVVDARTLQALHLAKQQRVAARKHVRPRLEIVVNNDGTISGVPVEPAAAVAAIEPLVSIDPDEAVVVAVDGILTADDLAAQGAAKSGAFFNDMWLLAASASSAVTIGVMAKDTEYWSRYDALTERQRRELNKFYFGKAESASDADRARVAYAVGGTRGWAVDRARGTSFWCCTRTGLWRPCSLLDFKSAVRKRLATAYRNAHGQTPLPAGYGNAKAFRDMVDVLVTEGVRRCKATDFDMVPELVGTPVGVFDLRTGGVVETTDLISHSTATAVDLTATCPQWRAFVKWAVNDDEASALALQKLFGLALRGQQLVHAWPMLVGPGGNGKSLFLDTLNHALGDYGHVVPPRFLVDKKGTEHTTDHAQLHGKRLVVSQETNPQTALDFGIIKDLTGGGAHTGRLMRQDSTTFEKSWLLCVATNHAPKLLGETEAIARRLWYIGFTRKPERPDVLLGDKLKAEAASILGWLYEGYQLAMQEIADTGGLARSPAIQADTDAYLGAADCLSEFMSAHLVPCDDPKEWVSVGGAFKAFTRWLEEEQGGYRRGNSATVDGTVWTLQRFGRELVARGVDKFRKKSGLCIAGRQLKTEFGAIDDET